MQASPSSSCRGLVACSDREVSCSAMKVHLWPNKSVPSNLGQTALDRISVISAPKPSEAANAVRPRPNNVQMQIMTKSIGIRTPRWGCSCDKIDDCSKSTLTLPTPSNMNVMMPRRFRPSVLTSSLRISACVVTHHPDGLVSSHISANELRSASSAAAGERKKISGFYERYGAMFKARDVLVLRGLVSPTLVAANWKRRFPPVMRRPCSRTCGRMHLRCWHKQPDPKESL